MKRKKRTLILLIMVLVFAAISGCGNMTEKKEKSKEVAMGRYVEETVAMPDRVTSGEEIAYLITKNPEHKLEAYGVSLADNRIQQYVLQPDRTWEISSPEWLQLQGISVLSVAYAPEGTRYAAAAEHVNDKIKVHIFKSADGISREEVMIEEFQEEVDYSAMPMGLEVMPDGRLLISYHDRIVLYDEGKTDVIFASGAYEYALSATGEQLMFVGENSDSIIIADTETGKVLREISGQTDLNSCAFTSDQEGNWYRLNHQGISRLIKDGSIWENLVDGGLASMSMPSYNMDAIIAGEQGEFYAMYQYGEGVRDIKHYTYDETMPSAPEETLTVISLEEDATVRQAIIGFQQKNSNVRIDYRSTNSEGSTIPVEDQIKAINTELLAGNGADLYILDGLPADSFIEKGALADISDLIVPMEESGQLLKAVIDGYKKDGAIYMAPLRFALPIAFGAKEAVDSTFSIQALAEYAGTKAKIPLFGEDMRTYEQLTKKLFRMYSDSFIKKDGSLDRDELVRFLDALQAICRQTKAFPGEAFNYEADEEDAILEALLVYEGASELGFVDLYAETDIYAPMSALEQTGGEYCVIQSKFTPVGMIGVNKAGVRKELVSAFIRELYSDEIQKTDVMQGFPVNIKALEQFGMEENDYYISGPSNFEAIQPAKERRRELIAMAKTVQIPVEQDNILLNMVWEEARLYLKGQTDSASAADKIISKASTYLAE